MADRVLPAEFVARLRALHEAGDPLLDRLLVAANTAGWTQQELADALGMSRQWAVWRITRWRRAGIPRIAVDVPPAPTREPGRLQLRKAAPELTPEAVRKLRAMSETAKTVNGATPAGDPRRAVSVELSRTLAELHASGISYQRLADAMGVHKATIRARLATHGYKTLPPSRDAYLGTPTFHPQTTESEPS
jgi:DNA-binding Lrp family transcriptional regulator